MKEHIVDRFIRIMPRKTSHILFFLAGFFLIASWTDVSPIDILFIALGTATLLTVVYRRDFKLLFYGKSDHLLLAFAAYVFFSLFIIAEKNYWFGLTTLYGIGIYFVLRYWIVRDNKIFGWVVGGYLVAAVTSSLLVTGAYLGRILSLADRNSPLFWQRDIRVAAFFDDPVVYGAFLVPALLVFLVRALLAGQDKAGLLPAISFFLVYLNILLTGARGSWLNVGVGLLVIVIPVLVSGSFRNLFSLRRIAIFGVAGVIIGTLVLFFIPIEGSTYYEITLKNRNVTSDTPRFETWKAAPLFSSTRTPAEKILGSGSGSFEAHSPSGISAHNTYLRVLFEQGIVGLAIFLTFLGTIVHALIVRIRKTPHRVRPWLFLAVMGGSLAQAFFIDVLHWRHLWVLLGLL